MTRWNTWAALAAAALAIGGCSDRKQNAQGERTSAVQSQQAGEQGQAGSSASASTDKAQQTEQQRDATAKQEQQQTSQQPGQSSAGATASAQQEAGQRSVNGSIVRASSDELVLRQEGGLPDLRLKVDGSTPVMLDGKQASVAELREGTQVRASYDEVNGEQRATRIEAHGSGAAQGSGTGTAASPSGGSGTQPSSTGASGTGTQPGDTSSSGTSSGTTSPSSSGTSTGTR
jgi:hypothetical protein